MTTQEGNDAIVARHLEALANAAKDYTLAELANITVGGASYALATTVSSGLMSATDKAKLDNLTNYTLPTASTTQKGGVIIGDGLQMDGDTLNVTLQSGSAGSGIDYVIGSNVSTVEGGFWQDIYNDVPILKLRHGDYEYNFQYDGLTRVSDIDSSIATVTPNTYVLGTASVSNDGGVWYEVNSNNVPTLNLHKGNFNYSFNYDSITYKGNNANLVAYLPFDNSTTADACGNEWVTKGNPKIQNGSLYLDNSCHLTNSTISDSIGAQPWAIDFWASATSGGCYFGTFNLKYGSSADRVSNRWIGVRWAGGTPGFNFYGNDPSGTIPVTSSTRHHYAVTYDETTLRLFVDGVLSVAYDQVVILGDNFCIGSSADLDERLTGSIDHFRIHKGAALWTENFTPPTAADYL